MAIDLTSVRTLLAVNGHGPDSSPEDITKLLAAAKYSPEEIATALSLLAQPPAPRPSTITIPAKETAKEKNVPYAMKASSYPAVTPVVTEHRMLGSVLKLCLFAIFLLVVGASLYVTSALAYPAAWLSMDAFCKGVPAETRAACNEGARPAETPWLEAR